MFVAFDALAAVSGVTTLARASRRRGPLACQLNHRLPDSWICPQERMARTLDMSTAMIDMKHGEACNAGERSLRKGWATDLHFRPPVPRLPEVRR
jgi:hypothetical protein